MSFFATSSTTAEAAVPLPLTGEAGISGAFGVVSGMIFPCAGKVENAQPIKQGIVLCVDFIYLKDDKLSWLPCVRGAVSRA